MVDSLNKALNLIDVLRFHARERPSHTVFEFERRRVTFGELERLSGKVANALTALGVQPGERVAYLGKNSDSYFLAMFGAMKIGAVIVPVNWRLTDREAGYILRDSDVSVVFAGPEARIPEGFAAVPGRTAHIVDADSSDTIAAWCAAFSDAATGYVIPADGLAVQLYTSGTTGNPKGAMLTQFSFVRHLLNMLEAGVTWNQWGEEDVSLLPMPLSHIGGTAWGLWGLFHGARTIIEKQFDIHSTFDRIEHDRVTKMFVVPAALQMMVRDPRAPTIDYSHITNMNYGASPISPALLKECVRIFGCGFTQMYGMTETIGTIVALPPEDHTDPPNRRMRGAGKAVPGVEIGIMDLNGNPVAPGVVGEVVCRGAAMMKGYWKLPEATAKTIDAQGWLHTGDAGYMDEDGYLYIHDRIKDMIISGGENVYSVEVESVLSEHPAVADVAVIGIPDERWGEVVMAVVVARPGHSLAVDELLSWARERLAGFKIPRAVSVVAELLRNPSGKVLKRELRAPYWKSEGRQVS